MFVPYVMSLVFPRPSIFRDLLSKGIGIECVTHGKSPRCICLEVWLLKVFDGLGAFYSQLALIFPVSIVHGCVSRLKFNFLLLPILIYIIIIM